MKRLQVEIDQATQELARLCPAGSTVYFVIRSVSRSGMSRTMSAFVYNKQADMPFFLDSSIVNADIAGTRLTKQGFSIRGCGMDMCYHVVDSINSRLNLKGEQALRSRII